MSKNKGGMRPAGRRPWRPAAVPAIILALSLQACGSSGTERYGATQPYYGKRPGAAYSSRYQRAAPRASYDVVGVASWYGKPYHGRRTASGEVYNMHRMTAAHPSLPFGTRVAVTNLSNGRTVVVRINDRGPFVRNRIIDVSRKAAGQLGFLSEGLTRVGVRIISHAQG